VENGYATEKIDPTFGKGPCYDKTPSVSENGMSVIGQPYLNLVYPFPGESTYRWIQRVRISCTELLHGLFVLMFEENHSRQIHLYLWLSG
jgi:hypothetical protein